MVVSRSYPRHLVYFREEKKEIDLPPFFLSRLFFHLHLFFHFFYVFRSIITYYILILIRVLKNLITFMNKVIIRNKSTNMELEVSNNKRRL